MSTKLSTAWPSMCWLQTLSSALVSQSVSRRTDQIKQPDITATILGVYTFWILSYVLGRQDWTNFMLICLCIVNEFLKVTTHPRRRKVTDCHYPRLTHDDGRSQTATTHDSPTRRKVTDCHYPRLTHDDGGSQTATTRCCNYSLFELLVMGACFTRNMYGRLQGIKYCTKGAILLEHLKKKDNELEASISVGRCSLLRVR
jgi:hypothetical protein